MRKIITSFFIFIFLINSVPLTAWGAVAENVVESSVENNEKLELGPELEPDLNSEENSSQKEIYESEKEAFVENEDFDEIVEAVEEKQLVEDDKIDDIEKVEELLESEADNNESIKNNVEEIVESGESKNFKESSQEENGDKKYDDEVKYSDNEDGSVSFEVKKEQVEEKGKVSFEYKDFEVIFSKIEKDGILTIKEVKLSEEEIKDLNAVSDIAYDVTLTDEDGAEFENGTFKYDLVFPLSKDVQEENSKIEVEYAENLAELIEGKDVHKTDDDKTKEKDEKLIVEDLDHFTIFVATTPDPDTSEEILINEALVNPLSGENEWVELYNNTDADIDLTGWTIKDAVNPAKDIIVDNAVAPADNIIPAGGFYVFEYDPGFPITGWLNDTPSETVSIFDGASSLVDKIEIDALAGSEIDNYPFENQSVGRVEDSGDEWILFEDNNAVLNPISHGYSNVPSSTGKIIFKSYVCADSVGVFIADANTKNDYKPKNDGNIDGDLSDCVAVGGYNIGHGGDAVGLPVPEDGIFVGSTESNGILEIDIEARNENYIFGQLDIDDKWIGFEDDKVYSDEVLGFACTDSNDGGFRDNNAEAFVVKAGETTYCNLYASETIIIPDTPEFVGFNEQGASNLGDIPTYYSCGVAVNGSSKLSGTWTDVSASGTNVRYIRHNMRPNGANDILLDGKSVKNLASNADSEDLNILSTMDNSYPDNHTGSWGSFGANEGLYQTRIIAFSDIDNNGKYDVNEPISEWSDYCEITYDATAPDVFNVALPDGSVTNGDSITQEWGSTSDDVDYYIYESYNDEAGTDLRWTKEFPTTSKTATNVGDAEYWWGVKAVDHAGNISELSELWKITVDNIVPITPVLEGFLNPDLSCNSVTNSGTITVNWTDSDGTGSDIVQYEYQINYPKPDGTRGVWNTFKTVSELTGSLNEGVHYIRVRAQDEAGNWSDWSSDWIDPSNLTQDEKDLNCSIALDTISPEITVDSLITKKQSPKLTGTVDDPDAVISINVDGNDYVAINNGDGTWTLPSGTIADLVNGTYEVVATATDLAGNVGIDVTVDELVIDTVKPNLVVDTPTDDTFISGNFQVTGTSSDEVAGVKNIRVRFRNESDNSLVETCWATYDETTEEFVLNVNDGGSCNVPDGYYKIVVRSRDNVGNNSFKTVRRVTIDNVAPILTEVTPVDSPTNDNTPDYTFNSDEAGTITYGGSCSSLTSEAIIGDNTITFDSLPDGVYDDCTITVTDATGNVSNVLNVSEFIIDTEKPTASQLSDQSFNEGDSVPLLTVNGQDNLEISEFCFSVTEEVNGEFIAEICSTDGLGTSYDWNNISSELPNIFDTSMISEGVYTVNYYVVDKVGNQSDNYSVKYTLNNVAPSVEFSVEDDDIDENDDASFNASFTDPSSIDAGDGLFDDSEWYAVINYGEGGDVNLGTFSNVSAISIPDHEYKHDGDFVAKLTVCESNINSSSEKECTIKEVSIEVDDIDDEDDDDDDDDEEEIAATTTYSNPTNYYVSDNNTTSDEEIVEEVIEEEEEIKPVVKKVEKPKKEEDKGIVAGEQTCKDNWPFWAWILIVIAFGSLASLIGNGTKTSDENASSIFWQAMLMILTLVIWYFFDSCRSFIWVPILTAVSGAIIATIFYKGEETTQN